MCDEFYNNINFNFGNHYVVAPYVSAPSILQPLHTLPASSNLTHSQPIPADPQGPPPGPTPMQPMGPIMQQRPDCRLVSASSQANNVAYPSCMVANNTHAGHMEQTDPLNYEPYIWSF